MSLPSTAPWGQRLVKAAGLPCPLEDDIWDEWLRAAGDWELRTIGSNAVFPSVDEEKEAQAFCTGFKNFTSFHEDVEEAKKELERLKEVGYSIEIKWDQVVRNDAQGNVSKMALIVKTKQNGSVKRRIIVDLRRS